MAERTIPEPTKEDMHIARVAIMETFRRNGVDDTEQNVLAAIEEIVAVKAQMNAEIRWLHNMIHLRK